MPNKAILNITGHVGADAEQKTAKNGKKYVNFSVAVSSGHRDPQTKEWVVGDTVWHRVMTFQNQSSILRYVKKGVGVSVSGNPKYGAYFSKRTGEAVPDILLFANEVSIVLYDKKDTEGGNTEHGQAKADGYAPDSPDTPGWDFNTSAPEEMPDGFFDIGGGSNAPDADVPF